MGIRASYEKVAKAIPVVRLAKHKLHVFVDAVFGVELLATTIADKHMATVLNLVCGGDEADGKADTSVCHQLGQYFQGTAGSMDHQYMFRQAGLS